VGVELGIVAGQVTQSVGDHLVPGERRPPDADIPGVRGCCDVEEPGFLILARDDESRTILVFPEFEPGLPPLADAYP
jgi:hypothetical protein